MKLKKTLCIISIILIVVLFFLLGKSQGHNKIAAEYNQAECDNKILPYGCKLDENATHCFVINCQKVFQNKNTAFCKEIKNYTDLSIIENIIVDSMGLIMFGCVVDVEEIGINPYTGNENWKFK